MLSITTVTPVDAKETFDTLHPFLAQRQKINCPILQNYFLFLLSVHVRIQSKNLTDYFISLQLCNYFVVQTLNFCNKCLMHNILSV